MRAVANSNGEVDSTMAEEHNRGEMNGMRAVKHSSGVANDVRAAECSGSQCKEMEEPMRMDHVPPRLTAERRREASSRIMGPRSSWCI